MCPKHILLALSLAFALPAGTSVAEITLTIDSGTKELLFGGSDTGSLAFTNPFFGATWRLGSGTTFGEFVDPSSAFTPAPDIAGQLDVLYTAGVPSGLQLFLTYFANETSLSAQSPPTFDYSSLSSASVSYLDSLGAGSMALTQGTGWQAISISPVPEPSTLMALGILGGVVTTAATLRSRWRASGHRA